MSRPDEPALRAQHQDWLAQQLAKKNPNPCVEKYGAGPEGRTCKGCRFIRVHQYVKNYYKCAQRKISKGSATDHRVSWQACAKFEEIKS